MPKATATLTTADALAPVSTRRQALGGAALAALTGAAAILAIVLPNPGEAFPAMASPDAELIALCTEFLAFDLTHDTDDSDEVGYALLRLRDQLAERISATRAVSAAGLQGKAKVAHFLMMEKRGSGGGFDDVEIHTAALLRELMGGEVDPAAVPTSQDAALLQAYAEFGALEKTYRATDFAAAQTPLMERMTEHRAVTREGRAARVRSLIAFWLEAMQEVEGTTVKLLSHATFRDLVAEA